MGSKNIQIKVFVPNFGPRSWWSVVARQKQTSRGVPYRLQYYCTFQSCVPLERSMHVENLGCENQTLTFGEVATEFITEPVDATRIEVEHEAEGKEGSEHGEEELE